MKQLNLRDSLSVLEKTKTVELGNLLVLRIRSQRMSIFMWMLTTALMAINLLSTRQTWPNQPTIQNQFMIQNPSSNNTSPSQLQYNSPANQRTIQLNSKPSKKDLKKKPKPDPITSTQRFRLREHIQRFRLLFIWCLIPTLWDSNIRMTSIKTRYTRFLTRSLRRWSSRIRRLELLVSWMLTHSRDGINLKTMRSKSKWSNWLPMVDSISQWVLAKRAVLKPMESLLKALQLEASS